MSFRYAAPLALLSALAFAAPARAEAPVIKVAVANTSRIFNEMQETKDLKEKLEARRKEITAEQADRQNKLKEMEQGLQNMKPDHPQYKKGLEELDDAAAKFETWGKVVRVQAERDQKMMMRNLFGKIQSAVADVAKDQGIDLVVADQGTELPGVEGLNFDQIRQIIAQRNVLYASKKADISDAVLTLLDAKYAKEKSQK